jgi:ferritin-like metal-binding protein YciE
MKLSSLRDLLVMELRDLHDCENELVQALRKMAEKAHDDQLRSGFSEHLEQTREHVRRLEQVFRILGQEVKSEKCAGIRGIIKEGDDLIGDIADGSAVDAGLIASAQKAEHYEMAAYGTVCTWADLIGERQASELLRRTLDEEEEADRKLTELALNLNREAAHSGRQ